MSCGDERGVGIVEVLLAMVIGSVILAATLTTYIGFMGGERDLRLQAEGQDLARVAIDRLSRDLHNQVSSTAPAPASLERAEGYDLIFLTFAPSPTANARGLRRVRYCVDNDNTLQHQVQTWTTPEPPSMPPASACPAPGWTSTVTLFPGVINRRGADRPVWTYLSVTDGPATTVTGIETLLWVAADKPGASETSVRSAVQLRNANRPPVAAFTITASSGSVILNAAPAIDPDGQPLRYAWSIGTTPIGSSARIEHSFPRGTTNVTLQITDNGGLSASRTQPVVVP